MKQFLNLILTLMLLTSITSCQNNFKLIELIDENSPFILKRSNPIKSSETIFSIDTLAVNSEKWNKILEFAKDQEENWKSTPASFNPDFSISQENFQLLGWNNNSFIVIIFTDEKGKSKQLKKTIRKNELKFLLN